MTREEAIKELERISEDTVQRDCSSCGHITAGFYLGVCCYCSLCQVVPEIFRDYHESKHFRSYWKWDGERKNEAMEMAIAALREQESAENAHCNSCKKCNGWIPVTERLPEELVPVLIYEPEYARGYKSMATAFRINEHWQGCVDGAVTHWMPLPEGPEVEV